MVDHKYMARVYLMQARNFRQHAAFHAALLEWAANRRRRAAHETRQLELFQS